MEAIVSCYEKFDKIVSATEIMYEINKSNLSTDATENKFTFATNLLDEERIEKLKNESSSYVENNNQYIIDGFGAEDIYQGLKAFIDGNIPNDKIFELHKYKKKPRRVLFLAKPDHQTKKTPQSGVFIFS